MRILAPKFDNEIMNFTALCSCIAAVPDPSRD